MPKLYSVTLYYNTGFDHANIPATPEMLLNFEKKQFDAVFKFQSRYINQIKIKASWDDVRDADYCYIANGDDTGFYVIDGITMASNMTAVLSLTLDPLLTAGGIHYIEVIKGWVRRAHTVDDTLFANTIEEPFVPSAQTVMEAPDIFGYDYDEGVVSIVGTTVAIASVYSANAAIYKFGETTAEESYSEVVVPALEPAEQETLVKCNGYEYKLPSTSLYVREYPGKIFEGATPVPGFPSYEVGKLDTGLSLLRSLGIEGTITCSYSVPKACIDGNDTQFYYEQFLPTGEMQTKVNAMFVRLAGTRTSHTSLPFNYGEVKNKKALTLFNNYTLTSIVSGDSLTYEARTLYNNSTAPVFNLIVDPSPNGTVYCQPAMFMGVNTEFLQQSVVSGSWLNMPLAMYGSSGSSISNAMSMRAYGKTFTVDNLRTTQANIMLEQTELQQNIAKRQEVADFIGGAGNVISSIASVKTNPAEAIGGAISGVADLGAKMMSYEDTARLRELEIASLKASDDVVGTYNYYAMGDNLFNRAVTNSIGSPTILYPQSTGAQCYVGHKFMVTQTHLSDADLRRFDRFLTMYGYAQDREFQQTDLQGRTKFNYILCSDIQIKSANASRAIIELLEDMLCRGIRIWHVPPTKEAYDDNPIKVAKE